MRWGLAWPAPCAQILRSPLTRTPNDAITPPCRPRPRRHLVLDDRRRARRTLRDPAALLWRRFVDDQTARTWRRVPLPVREERPVGHPCAGPRPQSVLDS